MFLLYTDDERCAPLRTQLDNQLLMVEQKYPGDVLTAKRLMTDFVPATEATKQRIEMMEDLNA